MKAVKTFSIGLFVFILSLVQFLLTFSPVRFIGIGVGLFFIIWGWKIGWTINRKLTTLVGHLALTTGLLVSAFGLYQIPFTAAPPSLLEVLDLPLFWGFFTTFGGYCMITHGYCNCAIKMHNTANRIKV